MRNYLIQNLFVVPFYLVSCCAFAQASYAPPTTLERNIETYVVKSDGSYAQTTEVVIRVETPQGIEDAGTQQISFISSNESIESVEAWTTQRDGTRIAVPPDSIRTREEDNAAGAAEFSDTRIKAIIFPQVAVGSRVSYKSASRVHTPPYQGEFNASFVFSPSVRIEHWELHISLPAARRLFIEMRGVTGGLQETVDGVSHYRFQHQRNTVNSPENGRVGTGDFGDFLRVSTLPDMVALGAAYHANARSKAAVTEDIRALATRLTADMTDDREKARALYHWVARNIRYVAVFLGNGRLVPHAAHEVLANRYGDCKDHAVLLEALLAAVGIESSPALINSGTTYTLPKVGAHGPINHVITYVPSMDLYLDSTSAFTSFGSLPFSDMDKPVVLTALGKMGRTPRTTATNNVSRVKVAMRMLPDGSIEGESRSSLTGVAEIASRAARFNARNSPEEDVVKELLFRFNETGIGSIANADPEALGRPYWVESKFRLDALSNVPGRGAIAMPVGLAPGSIAWIGSDKPLRRRLMPYACRSQTVEEKYIISLPPNVALDEIPRGVKYRDGAARYESSYRRAGRTVSVERKLVVQRDSHVCEPGENKRWDALHRVVQRDLRAQIFYR